MAMTTLRDLGEWGLIQALQDRFKDLPPGWIGIGDDTAVGDLTPGWKVLTTVDMLVEDLHFRRRTIEPEALGWKSLAVNLSDIASMGGVARWAVIGLSVPGELEAEWVLRFYDGLAELARKTGVRLVGGDTVGSTGAITIALTAVGESPRPLLRSSAEPGDVVFVTGPVGRAAAGFWAIENPGRVEASSLDRVYIKAVREAHLRPEPQLPVGQRIRELGVRVALLDNSDGLARSALLLAEANHVDIRLEEGNLPLDDATRAIAALAEVAPVTWALSGGEDYNLIGTIAPEHWPALASALADGPVHRIGEVLPGTGRTWVRRPDQQVHELTGEGGFEHFRAAGG